MPPCLPQLNTLMKMNTLKTTNTIEPPEPAQGRQDGPEACQDIIPPPDNEPQLRQPHRPTAGGEGIVMGRLACSKRAECTYETHEIDEADEGQEPKETEETQETGESNDLQERQEVSLGPKLFLRIDKAIPECRVLNGDTNRPLFMLAHKVRSIEEELNVRFSIDATA